MQIVIDDNKLIPLKFPTIGIFQLTVLESPTILKFLRDLKALERSKLVYRTGRPW